MLIDRDSQILHQIVMKRKDSFQKKGLSIDTLINNHNTVTGIVVTFTDDLGLRERNYLNNIDPDDWLRGWNSVRLEISGNHSSGYWPRFTGNYYQTNFSSYKYVEEYFGNLEERRVAADSNEIIRWIDAYYELIKDRPAAVKKNISELAKKNANKHSPLGAAVILAIIASLCIIVIM